MRNLVLIFCVVLCFFDFDCCDKRLLILFMKMMFGVRVWVKLNRVLISFLDLFRNLFVKLFVEMEKNVDCDFVVIV